MSISYFFTVYRTKILPFPQLEPGWFILIQITKATESKQGYRNISVFSSLCTFQYSSECWFMVWTGVVLGNPIKCPQVLLRK